MAPAGPAPMTATLLTGDKDGMFSTTTTVKVVQMPPTKSRTRLDHNISVFQPRRPLRTPSAKGLVSDHRSGPGPRNRDAAVSKTPVNADCAISRHHLGRILPQSSPRFGFHDENVRKSEPHLGISGVGDGAALRERSFGIRQSGKPWDGVMLGSRGWVEFCKLDATEESRPEIHVAGSSRRWMGSDWWCSLEFHGQRRHHDSMAQIQPSSSEYDTKAESNKSDGVLSSSEQEGEWDVVEEARARRKQVLFLSPAEVSVGLGLTLGAAESTPPSFPSSFWGYSSSSSIA